MCVFMPSDGGGEIEAEAVNVNSSSSDSTIPNTRTFVKNTRSPMQFKVYQSETCHRGFGLSAFRTVLIYSTTSTTVSTVSRVAAVKE